MRTSRDSRFTTKFRIADEPHPLIGTRCWLWTAYTMPEGYGQCRLNGRVQLAHRIAYTKYIGPIPEGLHIDHLCRVRNCVNPAHLEPVTPRENNLRGTGYSARSASRTHCPRGHPYSGDNLRIGSVDGKRYCRACSRVKSMAYYYRTRRAQAGQDE